MANDISIEITAKYNMKDIRIKFKREIEEAERRVAQEIQRSVKKELDKKIYPGKTNETREHIIIETIPNNGYAINADFEYNKQLEFGGRGRKKSPYLRTGFRKAKRNIRRILKEIGDRIGIKLRLG